MISLGFTILGSASSSLSSNHPPSISVSASSAPRFPVVVELCETRGSTVWEDGGCLALVVDRAIAIGMARSDFKEWLHILNFGNYLRIHMHANRETFANSNTVLFTQLFFLFISMLELEDYLFIYLQFKHIYISKMVVIINMSRKDTKTL